MAVCTLHFCNAVCCILKCASRQCGKGEGHAMPRCSATPCRMALRVQFFCHETSTREHPQVSTRYRASRVLYVQTALLHFAPIRLNLAYFTSRSRDGLSYPPCARSRLPR
jgi:hypothetical protein